MTDNKYWIQTHTGERIVPAEIRRDQVHIEDIAHALSLKCRFTGHCPAFYSVAQHSVHVAENCPPEAMLAGLLHDAHETYLADLAGPTKLWLRDQGVTLWDSLETWVQSTINLRFNVSLSESITAAVKRADTAMLATEAWMMFGLTRAYEHWPKGERAAYPKVMVAWEPDTAKGAFLALFRELTK